MMTHRRQSGISLVVGLVILLLLTIITLTAIQVTALEEKMAGNLLNQNIAFQAAESALREAEALIRTDVAPFSPLRMSGAPFRHSSGNPCGTGGHVGMCSTTEPLQSEAFQALTQSEMDDWKANGWARTAATGIPDIAQPVYIIELIRTKDSTDSSRIYGYFLITTRAWGRDENTVVQLQSTYRLHARSYVH